MKFLQLVILLIILTSCKKENIYYYSDNKQIKDSTVIRFIDEELKKINTKEKNLKIYTTLDSTSYKNNLDSIRNKIFIKSLEYNLKPKDRHAFNNWFREKIIVVDNKSGKIVNFYSSFRNKKYDRKDVPLLGLRKIIRLGNILHQNPSFEIPENYLLNYPSLIIPVKELKITKEEIHFLSKFSINNFNMESYFYNYISYLDAIKLFQSYNNGLIRKPFIVEKILEGDEIIYVHKDQSNKIFTNNSLEKINNLLSYSRKNSSEASKNQIENIENLVYFGSNQDHYMMINDGKYTYLIYIFGAVITNLEKKESRSILPNIFRQVEIKYYKAIRK
ncbi:MAG: hypothetical protein DI622_00845 [Chryseobacterium sp.]|nr:MAG: hypothetical protein DI622_00845 [Chryseobacterium sp.]